MNLSPTNIQPQVPPGFRFHPTEEELLNYYLRKKVAYEKIDLDVIRDVDLNKLEPWEIQEICKIGSTHQNDWYFFSHKDKKYPTGTRTNRATSAGFWKATGRDKVIYTSLKRLGMRKTLVFYKGRAPHGQKSDWIMHEYRLEDPIDSNQQSIVSSSGGDSTQEEGWVVCRVFKKKSHPKSIDSPNHSTITGEFKFSSLNSGSNIALDQIIQYVGKQLSQETDDGDNNDIAMKFLTSIQSSREHEYHPGFLQRPPLVNQSILPMSDEIQLSDNLDHGNHNLNPVYQSEPILNWAVMDRVVGCHLNGQSETLKQLVYFTDTNFNVISDQSIGRIFTNSQESNNDNDLWCVDRSSSILSVTSQVSQVNQKNPN